MPETGPIRKIIIGDIKEGMQFSRGQYLRSQKLTVTDIYMDVEWFRAFGRLRYCVVVQREGDDGSMIWKYTEKPVTVEYDV